MLRNASSASRLLCALVLGGLAGCAHLPSTTPSGDTFPQRYARLKTLCASDPRPSDGALGDALRLSTQAVEQWRSARSLDAEQICRLPENRLARSLAKSKKADVAGSSEDVRKYIELFQRDEHGQIPDDGMARAVSQREAILKSGRDKSGGIGGWTAVGPDVVAGRVRAILYDRIDHNRVYLGAATGGIWISTDGGANWTATNDFASSLTISALAQDPNNANVLYAGTGEWVAGFRGIGVMRSADRGATWTKLNATDPGTSSCWRYVQDVATHPSNSSILFAGNWCGIYRSTDGGSSWTRVHQISNSSNSLGVGWRILFSPTDSNRVLAAMSGRQVALSTNGGASFTPIQVGTAVDSIWLKRVNIAWSKSAPSVVYASVNEDNGDIYKSTDGGANWTKTSNPKALGNQGEYGNTIWVDPTDADTIIVGGIDLHRSTDGGSTFSRISDWSRQYYIVESMYSAHADHHVIVNHPAYDGGSNRTALFGTDGGVYRADPQTVTNMQGWQVSSGGLVTTQFYAVSGRNEAGGLSVIGGTQDNSTFVLSPNLGGVWKQPGTGDGGPGYFDPTYPTRVYFSTQYLHLARWNVADDTGKSICEGITEATKADPDRDYFPCGRDATQKVNFIAPYIVDPANGERIYAGAASLWLSENARSAAQPSWRVIKAASSALIDGAQTNYLSTVAMRPGNANQIWVGHNNGEVYHTGNALAAAPSWTAVNGLPNRIVTSIVFDPTNTQRVFITFGGFSSGNVWMSDTYGANWQNVSAGLPQAPAYAIAVHPTQPNVLYVGTEVGLFVSENSGASWNTQNEGPAATLIRALFFADNNTLVAGTYGRGIWRTSTYNVPTIPVYEFRDTLLNHYFRTASQAEADMISATWSRWAATTDTFRAYPAQAPGTLGVCRFVGNPARNVDSHFYTISPGECESLKSNPDWIYEAIAFYAALSPNGTSCTPGLVPVYRLYNNIYPVMNHRFTTSSSVYSEMQAQGWIPEGVAMCVPAS